MEPRHHQSCDSSHVTRPVVPHLRTSVVPRHCSSEESSDEEFERHPPLPRGRYCPKAPPSPRKDPPQFEQQLDDIMKQIQVVMSKIERLESMMQQNMQNSSPSEELEHRLTVAVATAIEDHLDAEVLGRRIVNDVVPALDRWWANKYSAKLMNLMPQQRIPGASPPVPFSFSPSKRVIMNRSGGFGRTPGNASMLTDSLVLSDHGTDWGQTSQTFATPHTTLPISKPLTSEQWPVDLLSSNEPPSLGPIKEDHPTPTLSRETTATLTPTGGMKAVPPINPDETPKPSAMSRASPH
eukprot:Blabericola_migrator_1__4846@NODE_2540_length_2628_cov_141_420929_g768_i1_p1_GENE_NODE_2540_length_2628_cov_141_420929_g768_i1NODE_2540_length_2628_cov_141_420929_g768_i1_p1_ORF_typecomplete_len295_score43_30DUF4795/PF16043_5/0_054ARL6IP6/PF15062_6/0_45Phage_tail_U/PF06141_11/0_35_NODE_2540_length_2628_cov_141_420929_g768_i13381222